MITDNTLLISIDLETLGQLAPRAAIATIGMTAFDLAELAEPVATHYTRIERESALQVGKSDQSTLDWWARQPAEARAEIEGGDTPLRTALMGLAEALDGITAGRDPSEVIVVARAPSFDCAILAYHYDHFGIPLPWRYWQERDHRSIEDAYRDTLVLLGKDAPSYREMAQVAHHALKDATAQALYLLALRRMVREARVLAEKPIDSVKERRIAACLNACKSVSTEDLERYYETGAGIDEALEEAGLQAHIKAIQQCDQLLAALVKARRELQACQSVIHLAGGFDPAYVTGAKDALRDADAAIAAVKGGAA